jgi:hypothetical protein
MADGTPAIGNAGGVEAARMVSGTGCTLIWARDGRTVDKRYDAKRSWFLDHMHRGFDRERRANQLLLRHPPPVRFPRLLSVDHRSAVLRFEAVDAEPYGPKYPTDLAAADVDALVDLAFAMRRYRPRGARAVRFDPARRLHRAVRDGVLSPTAAAAFGERMRRTPAALRFCHADITARNVLRSAAGPVLIDWEWAGIYPDGWDPAVLWFSLRHVPEARTRIEARLSPSHTEWFWYSALLIELLHLSMWSTRPDTAFRAAHERERDDLVARVLDGAAGPRRQR